MVIIVRLMVVESVHLYCFVTDQEKSQAEMKAWLTFLLFG